MVRSGRGSVLGHRGHRRIRAAEPEGMGRRIFPDAVLFADRTGGRCDVYAVDANAWSPDRPDQYGSPFLRDRRPFVADGSGMDETFARADETVGNRDQHASLPIRHPFRSEAAV